MRGRGDCPDLQVGVAPDVVVFLVADDDAAVFRGVTNLWGKVQNSLLEFGLKASFRVHSRNINPSL